MRRALLAITGLAASTTALVVFKAAPGTGQLAQEVPAPAPTATQGPEPTPGKGATKPKASGSPKPTRSASGASRSGSSAAPKTPAAQPSPSTVVGPVVSNEFGEVQVRITVVGGQIVNAAALRLPRRTAQSDQRSDQVDSRYSGTVGMVVERQSADLDTVTGATATSDSYRGSLQAAIDQVR